MNQTLPPPQHTCLPDENENNRIFLTLRTRQRLIESEFQEIIRQLKSNPITPSSKITNALIAKLKKQSSLIGEEK